MTVTTWTVIRDLARRFSPYRWQLAGSLLMVVLSMGLSVGAPLLLQRIIDDALPNRDGALLGGLCALMIAAGLAGSILNVAETALTNWIGQNVTMGLRLEIHDLASAQPLDFYNESSGPEIQTRLVSDVDGVERFITNTAQDAVASLIGFGVTAIVMVILSWPLALASITLAVLLGLLNNRFARRRRDLARERQKRLTDILRHVAENLSLGGVVLGRTLGRTHRQRAQFVETCEQIKEATFRQRVTGTTAYTLIGFAFSSMPPLIYWLSGTVVSGLSAGTVVIVVLLQMRLSMPLQNLLQLSGNLQASVAMFERIQQYLDLPSSITATPEPPQAARPTGPASVSLRGVSYEYGGSNREVVSDVTLDFPAGSVTVVVGRTGAGKSTLGMLLAGLLPPSGGTIQIDGEDKEHEDLRAVVSLVPQHVTLFNTSIRDNLMFARDDAAIDELERAIAAVRLDDLLAALPDAYATRIGQDGHQLSGGERQRLAIARGLLADCRMLVVDEGTSALDNVTAQHVHESLRRHCGNRTLVIIAHRIPRLDSHDHVVVMDKGRIVETGTHADLSVYSPRYKALLAAPPTCDRGDHQAAGSRWSELIV